jgi:hypothetical protein
MFGSFSPFSSCPYERALRVPVRREHATYHELPRQPQTEPVTSNSFFKIVIVLDESGSMESVRDAMKNSINDLIKEQQQIKERPATFSLVKFNDKVNRVIKNKPLEDIKLLNSEDYKPNGSTALYDCIGDTIEWFRNEKDVLLVIVTDGQENASRSFSKNEVTRMIEDKKKNNGWTYVYLSNDLNTAAQGDGIGCSRSAYATNAVVEQKKFGAYMSNNLNSAISNYRKDGISVQKQLNSD